MTQRRVKSARGAGGVGRRTGRSVFVAFLLSLLAATCVAFLRGSMPGAARLAGVIEPSAGAQSLPPPSQPSKEYIYAGGRLVATEEPSSTPTPAPTNAASFSSQSAPPQTMSLGQTFQAVVKMQNTGTTTWTAADNYSLGYNVADSAWGVSSVGLTAPVAPGQTAEFDFTITAPTTQGSYFFEWQMRQNGVWFGAATPPVSVNVVPARGAVFIQQSVQSPMVVGQSYLVSLTMRNTGADGWSGTASSGCRLGAQNPQDNMTWGLNRVAPTSYVPPGAEVTFTFRVTPSAPGPQNFQWRMVCEGGGDDGWFGEYTPNTGVTVLETGGGGTLDGIVAPAPSGGSVDLASEGTLDWAHWGLDTPASFDHKAGVTQRISNYVVVGGGSVNRLTDLAYSHTWAGGTPTQSAATTTGVTFSGAALNGFQVTAPADTSVRTLKLYVGAWYAQGYFRAWLSDGSAPTYADFQTGPIEGTKNYVYTISYKAASAGQTLTVSYTMGARNFPPNDNITLQAATLSGPPPKEPATLTLGGLSGQIYDGTPKAASVMTSPAGLGGVSVTYDGSSALPTNAGSYSVAATLSDPNYEAPPTTGTLVIQKGTASITLSNLEQTYDGSPKSVTAATSPQGLAGLSVTYNEVTAAPTDAGSYAVAAAISDPNYQAPPAGATLVIDKASSTTTVSASDATYNGNPHGGTAAVTGAGGLNQSLTVSYTGRNATTYGPSTTAPTSAGDYTASASYGGDPNHVASSGSKDFSIGKAAQTITFAALSDKTFGDAPFGVSAAGGASGNAVTFSSQAPSVCSVSGSTVSVLAAGTCTIMASQAGNSNYNAAPDIARFFHVAKAGSTTTVSASDATYDGQPHGGTASATGAGGLSQSLTISYSGRNGTSYGPTTTAPTNAGDYTASASYGGDSNHNASSGGKDFQIAKAQTTIALGNLTQSYDTTPRVVTASTISPAGLSGVTVTYNGSTTAPVNVGSYQVSATLSNVNYTAPAATGTLVVNKGTATITLGGLTGQVYDGAAKSATASTLPAGLTVNITYAQNGSGVTAPTGAGNYDVTATVNDANYQGSNTGTLVISKHNAILALGGLTGHTYNGSPQSATVTTDPSGLSGVTITYGGSTTAPTNVGSYTIVASLTNANYSADQVSGLMAVTKATPTITWNNPADIGQGTALGSTQFNATASAAGTFAYTPASGTVLGVGNNQALSVSFTPTDTADYNAASASVHINVIGCPVAGSSTFTGTSPILTGSSSTLSWNVPYASSVSISSISGSLGTFGSTGSASVTPSLTTTYTLTATGASVCSNMTKQTTVVVNTQSCPHADPHFPVFAASPDTVTAGGSSTLNWSAPGATHVRVYIGDACQPGDSSCELYSGSPSGGSITVSPTETTTYNFEATGTQGCTPVTGQATVMMMGDPATCSPNATFTTTPASGGCNGNITINWSVPNAMSVDITTDGDASVDLGYYEGSAAQSGQITVSGGSTLSYTLTAQLLTIDNEDGSPDSCGTIQMHTTHTCP
jgi:hypothetical protein